jgi:hypothetical protein
MLEVQNANVTNTLTAATVNAQSVRVNNNPITPSGTQGSVQINSGSSFGSDSTLTFNTTTKQLTCQNASVTSALSCGNLSVSNAVNNLNVAASGLRLNTSGRMVHLRGTFNNRTTQVINVQFLLQGSLGVSTGPSDGLIIMFLIVDTTTQIAGFYHGFMKQGLPPFLVGGRTGAVTVAGSTLSNGTETFSAISLTSLTSTSTYTWSAVCFMDGYTR